MNKIDFFTVNKQMAEIKYSSTDIITFIEIELLYRITGRESREWWYKTHQTFSQKALTELKETQNQEKINIWTACSQTAFAKYRAMTTIHDRTPGFFRPFKTPRCSASQHEPGDMLTESWPNPKPSKPWQPGQIIFIADLDGGILPKYIKPKHARRLFN